VLVVHAWKALYEFALNTPKIIGVLNMNMLVLFTKKYSTSGDLDADVKLRFEFVKVELAYDRDQVHEALSNPDH